MLLFLGGKPKTKFGTNDLATNTEGRTLFLIFVVMIDPKGEENPVPITVTVPQSPGKFPLGTRLSFQGLAVSYYALENGRSGLSWNAEGFRENISLPSQGGKNAG